jgi:hypothetical protein
MYALVNGGDEALWEFLDAYYECVFHKDKYPTPTEFEKKPRRTSTRKLSPNHGSLHNPTEILR